MKKGVLTIIGISLAIVLISVGFVSAGWWSDFWDLFTGEDDSGTGALYTSPGGNLIAHWAFENNVADSAGSHDGISYGVAYASGKINKAGSFDGVSKYVEVSDNADLKPSAFSISAWIYPKAIIADHLGILEKDWEANKGYALTLHNGIPFFYVNKEDAWKRAQSSIALNTNKWYHIAGTFDGTTARIYIDGILMGSIQTTYASGNAKFTIGHVQWTSDEEEQSYFNGLIDEVKFWNYALSADEVVDEYNLEPVCTPNCAGKACGADDGCGNPCQTGTCPTGKICQLGICINETQANCTDSDGGKVYGVKGKLCDINGDCIYDSCDGDQLTEHFCDDPQDADLVYHTCPYGCQDGACVAAPTCTDTDDGIKYYLNGTTTDSTGSNSDTCSGKNLTEFYCDGTVKKSVVYECPDTCEAGVCIREEVIEIIDNSFQFIPSLVVAKQNTDVFETLEIEDENVSVPENRTATVVKPDGSLLGVVLGKIDFNCINYTGGHMDGQRRCYAGYSYNYIPPVTGVYFIQEDLEGVGKLKVVPTGYFAGNLRIAPDSGYNVGYNGSYDAVQKVIFLTAEYSLTDPSYTGENYIVEVLKFESEEEAQVDLDLLLNSISAEVLSSLQDVNGNLVYIFKDPLKEDMIGILWKSGINVVVGLRGDESMDLFDMNVEEFIQGLSGQVKAKFVSINYNDIHETIRYITEQYIALYPSDINGTECISNWECVTTPTVCPGYGKQVKTCIDISECNKDDIVTEIPCQPGICSGCMLPPNELGISQCAPFGFRLRLDDQNKYCDVDGQVKVQKAVEDSCQNNFECESNTCSDRVCVGLVEEIREQTNLLRRIWCWITNLFDKEGRDVCLGSI